MIYARIESSTKVYNGKFDPMTGLVYLELHGHVQVETVQNLRDRAFVIQLKEMPEEAQVIDFNGV